MVPGLVYNEYASTTIKSKSDYLMKVGIWCSRREAIIGPQRVGIQAINTRPEQSKLSHPEGAAMNHAPTYREIYLFIASYF